MESRVWPQNLTFGRFNRVENPIWPLRIRTVCASLTLSLFARRSSASPLASPGLQALQPLVRLAARKAQTTLCQCLARRSEWPACRKRLRSFGESHRLGRSIQGFRVNQGNPGAKCLVRGVQSVQEVQLGCQRLQSFEGGPTHSLLASATVSLRVFSTVGLSHGPRCGSSD